ncbi:CHAT domain-containing tetratricopeptide repeat protein [Plastoroseomonas arctica]|uniref:CHAT domain-containing protein n=1 Tax=Plastoroseomonas arctica TaxID=1509237 RepID=A0AAF1K794_9PROT|nr:CHAT domain-containing protein [Plastoroseomonas arctica]MBR0656946.1 CHAT domain-containing protein [Plastoroseomonas arctica]
MVVLVLGAAPAPAQSPPDAAAALATARATAAAGDPAAAERSLSDVFARAGQRIAPQDLAVLRLEAARLATDPARARAHLHEAERLLPAFRTEPILGARLRRELARLHEQHGSFPRAEQLLSLALPALERVDIAAAADAAGALGRARLELVQLDSAAAAFERSVALLASLPGSMPRDEAIVAALINLSTAWIEAGNMSAARAAVGRAQSAAEAAPLMRRQVDYARGHLLLRDGNPAAAETVLVQAVQAAGPGDVVAGHALLLLTTSRFERGRLPEAAEAGLAALAIYAASLGEAHPAYARVLHSLGSIHAELGDLVAAERFLSRAAGILEHALGPTSSQFHSTQLERSWIAVQNGHLDLAEQRAQAALRAFRVAPPPDSRLQGLAYVLQGLVQEKRSQLVQATASYRYAQVQVAAARGVNSPDLGFSLVRLGRLLTRTGEYVEAAGALERAIGIYGGLGDTGTVRYADAITARAELRLKAGDRSGSLEDIRRGMATLRGRIAAVEDAGSGSSEMQRRGAREIFGAQARILIDVHGADAPASSEAFLATQEALTTRAGEALRRAAGRRASGSGDLARLLREREETRDAWRQANAIILAAANRAGGAPAGEMNRLIAHRDALRGAMTTQHRVLARQFPDYARFLEQRPATLAATQASLSADEVLLMPAVFADYVLLWTITRSSARAVVIDVARSWLMQQARLLRDGVDLARNPPVEFSIRAARDLYDILIHPALRDLERSIDQLLIVPDSPFQSMSPHLLLGPGNRWLVQDFAVTVTPSVGSLVEARAANRTSSTAPMAFLGVGNPQTSLYATPSQLASRGSHPDLRNALSNLSLLPGSADELRAMARTFGEPQSTILLEAQATERGFIAAIPRRFRTIAFATHALMAGELPLLTEPAIVLTPADEDIPYEGLLTASDVAALELDADLIILSACNTAAPESGAYADALSGLARAFLHAGARNLLVSHWAVDDRATIQLTTLFVQELRALPGRPIAGALRAAILTMMNDQAQVFRHPAFWAPFIVVGS